MQIRESISHVKFPKKQIRKSLKNNYFFRLRRQNHVLFVKNVIFELEKKLHKNRKTRKLSQAKSIFPDESSLDWK